MPIQKDLSTVVQQRQLNRQSIQKLIVPGQKITSINKLQKSLACNVKVIDLSQNLISSLEGIQQFVNLQQLNISSNKIKACSQLLHLKGLKRLEKLYVKSNSFLNQPLDEECVQFISLLNTDLPILKQRNNQKIGQSQIYQTFSNISGYNKKSSANSDSSRRLLNSLSQQKGVEMKQTKYKLSGEIISKANQFIQEKQSSLEISEQQLKYGAYFQPSNRRRDDGLTKLQPIQLKRNYSKNQNQPQSINKIKKRQHSTNLSPRRRYSNSKSKEQQFFLQTASNRDKSIKKYQEKGTGQFHQNQEINQVLKKSSSKEQHVTVQKIGEYPSGLKVLSSSRKNIQMQVDNLMINIDSQDVNLNYGSIIQKQQDQSYQLEFDFINRQGSPNPKRQLKYDQNTTKKEEVDYKINSFKEQYINQQIKSNQDKNYNKRQNKKQQSQSHLQLSHNSYQSPTFLAVTPQLPLTQSYGFQGKNSLSSQVFINQNMQNLYYKHLVSVSPSLTLLYSSIPSLSGSQKNILLQILFKDHKQLFAQLSKQHLHREQTKNTLNQKSFHLDSLARNHQQLQNKINQLKLSSQKQIRIIQLLTVQKKQILNQNQDLKKGLKSRQKIIQDLEIDYKKLKKDYQKLQKKYELTIGEDQKEQIILRRRQLFLRRQYFEKIVQQCKNSQKINKMEEKRRKSWVINCWKALKQYQLVNLYIKTKQKFKQQKSVRQLFNSLKINQKLSKKQKVLQKWLSKCRQKQAISIFLNNKQSNRMKKQKLKKANKFFYRKYFLQWKSIAKKMINHIIQANQKAINFKKLRIIRLYFGNLKQTAKNIKLNHSQLQNKIKEVCMKFDCLKFIRNIKSIQKSRQKKTNKTISKLKSHFLQVFIALAKKKIALKKLKQKNMKMAQLKNLKRIFFTFKKVCSKAIQIRNQTSKSIRRITQNQRIIELVTQFKTYLIENALFSNKKKQCLLKFRNNLIKNKERKLRSKVCSSLHNKKFEVKWKWTIFNVLLKQMIMNKCNKSLQKYQKQSQLNKINFQQTEIMNQKTIQTLKGQVQLYNNELIFHKSQIQRLSQREMIILSEKEQCLLQLREREAIIQQLNSRLSIQSIERNDLNTKYNKILDLYAQTVDQYENIKINHYKNEQFMYDTINKGDKTLRKQNKRSISPVRDFSSLKNKHQKKI